MQIRSDMCASVNIAAHRQVSARGITFLLYQLPTSLAAVGIHAVPGKHSAPQACLAVPGRSSSALALPTPDCADPTPAPAPPGPPCCAAMDTPAATWPYPEPSMLAAHNPGLGAWGLGGGWPVTPTRLSGPWPLLAAPTPELPGPSMGNHGAVLPDAPDPEVPAPWGMPRGLWLVAGVCCELPWPTVVAAVAAGACRIWRGEVAAREV
ncbi:hypothetical protein V8C86DRAFT_1065316 [Haematococcus lacustris]